MDLLPNANYNVNDYNFSYGGFPCIGGIGENDFFNWSMNENQSSAHVGADGSTTFVKNNNRTGKLSLFLNKASPYNDVLSTLALSEQTDLGAKLPKFLLVKDSYGTTLISAQARIEKMPDLKVEKDGKAPNEWKFILGDTTATVGGKLL